MDREAVGLRMHGFVAALAEQGPARGPQHVFVNRRIVKDQTIAHAILDAYSVASNKERSPEVHLFLEIPPDRVDVNVHPTKAEVRFREQSLVHEIVRRAVADALGQGPAPELTLRPSDLIAGRPIAQSHPRRAGWRRLSEPMGPGADGLVRAAAGGAVGMVVPRTSASPRRGHRTGGTDRREAPVEPRPQFSGPDAMRPLIPLGQFRDTFIIAMDDDGIAIIDQHVAHERVLFERIMQRLTERPLESQRLLVPIDPRPGAGRAADAGVAIRGARTLRLRGGGVRRRHREGVVDPRDSAQGRMRRRAASRWPTTWKDWTAAWASRKV